MHSSKEKENAEFFLYGNVPLSTSEKMTIYIKGREGMHTELKQEARVFEVKV